MVTGTREIENKADVISISYMVYNAKKESRFFCSLLVVELDQPNWEGHWGYRPIQALFFPLFCTSPDLWRGYSTEISATERTNPLQKTSTEAYYRGGNLGLALVFTCHESYCLILH